MGLEALTTKAPGIAGELAKYVNEIDTTIDDIRQTVFQLQRPDASANLRDKLMRQVKAAGNALGFAPRVTVDHTLGNGVPDGVQRDLLAALGEALSNVVRHAEATAVDVTVHADRADGELTLEVLDNGVGMPEDVVRRSGLANLEARARRWRGRFAVSRVPGGTALTWTVPLPA
ncbi:sensor histidine kinase [Kibdelosporangium phytohabitans]|uniref:Histidine kinase/HSP90-like ATPase domain-containing protein n=1 Tax=Kibdelosporangium phytohabitans TaxID=860235 RepID=A0A0N9IA22_9PSEU|nr:ATP-binding protein [Kibdelosporangium phytohabitans]ALG11893.1 hypothetical protein AOZ06_38010 [Kibdelosporangium phytohabitans]MBE1463340.1 signal transduction histidine kinase [Kibdelosporangium phytohabitans]